jgi:hypothetical protein
MTVAITILEVLAVWFAFSIVGGIAVGKVLKWCGDE